MFQTIQAGIPEFGVIAAIFFAFVVMPYTIGLLVIGWPFNRNKGDCK